MNEKARPLIKNKVLAALSDREYQRLLPHLEAVDLPQAKVVYEMGGRIKHVYFPFNAMISLVTEMSDGKIVEVGLIGSDGVTGIGAVMGDGTSHERAIVQIANGGARAKLSVVKEEFQRGGELHALLLSHARRLMKQISQTAACNASHTAEERLSRWLLMCQDRVNSAELKLTQEFIAEMLGTRRATVSVSAMVLQQEGLIQYNRGHINIIDRKGLEAFTCECYAALDGSETTR